MPVNKENYFSISEELKSANTVLVAVSKTKPVEDIMELYQLGQKDFGENYVQELIEKQALLPKDIRWHFIGHLQTNKVKLLIPFVHLIQGVDSIKLLREINRQAEKAGRKVDVLLQVHIAVEETKFGLDEKELAEIFEQEAVKLNNLSICGLMGMATFTSKAEQVRKEFHLLRSIFEKYAGKSIPNCRLRILSMGMSGDYRLAIKEGSNMVRVGSLLFGERQRP
jgi:pyridoxal phosphate enzyme (YggS family)